jgi:uncharacterized membrane protein YphA (DoxX/SURF4 family)
MPLSVTMMELEKGAIDQRSGRGVGTYKRDDVLLWVIQGTLAAVFLLAGAMKLATPLAVLSAQSHLPGLLIRLVGIAEIVGASGLILPGVLRIRPTLTPIAASALMMVMIAATLITIATGSTALAAIPGVTGILCACVAYGRWRVAPTGTAPDEIHKNIA